MYKFKLGLMVQIEPDFLISNFKLALMRWAIIIIWFPFIRDTFVIYLIIFSSCSTALLVFSPTLSPSIPYPPSLPPWESLFLLLYTLHYWFFAERDSKEIQISSVFDWFITTNICDKSAVQSVGSFFHPLN